MQVKFLTCLTYQKHEWILPNLYILLRPILRLLPFNFFRNLIVAYIWISVSSLRCEVIMLISLQNESRRGEITRSGTSVNETL